MSLPHLDYQIQFEHVENRRLKKQLSVCFIDDLKKKELVFKLTRLLSPLWFIKQDVEQKSWIEPGLICFIKREPSKLYFISKENRHDEVKLECLQPQRNVY